MTVGIGRDLNAFGAVENRVSLGYSATTDSDDVTQLIEYTKEIGEEDGCLLSMGRSRNGSNLRGFY